MDNLERFMVVLLVLAGLAGLIVGIVIFTRPPPPCHTKDGKKSCKSSGDCQWLGTDNVGVCYSCDDTSTEEGCFVKPMCSWNDDKKKCIDKDQAFCDRHNQNDFQCELNGCDWKSAGGKCTLPSSKCSDAKKQGGCLLKPMCSWNDTNKKCTENCSNAKTEEGCFVKPMCSWNGKDCIKKDQKFCDKHDQNASQCALNACDWAESPGGKCILPS
jgi:hypothetical protein